MQAARFALIPPFFCLIASFFILMLSPSVYAMTGAGLELGTGSESTSMARVTARWDWNKRWSINQNWIASGFWETGLGYWQGTVAGDDKIWDLGVTPVFRVRSGVSPFYLEGAIGAHLLSKSHISNRSLGCSFNFGDMIGFGWNFGQKDHFELGYRFQHLSNFSLADQNDGINFHQLRLGYNY